MAEKDNIIELRGVTKNFEDTCALDNIDLEIRNGEFLTLLGPSGCGKTTILRLISGFEKPDAGVITLKGQRMDDAPPEARQVNTVFQNYALFPHMSVRENVGFGLRMQRRPKDEIARRVHDALRMVHLEAHADRRPRQLSGGQQQRVAIARAVVNNPLVLLLDEPFSALDYKLRKQMQLEIKHLQRQLGITFVFVTHDQEEAFAMSDRVVVMNDGKIEQIGSPQEIYEEPANLYVARFVGEINILNAVIAANHGDGLYDAVIEGVTFPIRSQRTFAPGDKVNVLLRPEDLRVYTLTEDRPAGPHLTGRIEESVYKGATVDLIVTLSDGRRLMAAEFFNEDDVDINYNPGETVTVSWVDGWEVVLPDGEA
ncbi:spermidine/putrescine ABC transporter ATP-binding protein PotA [Nitratidesulfovibrio vulgaris]|jgi:spermidine/putrescine transport system ATP-binding protein|uniref:Spermidine/putrescine import ATP-binding protein PotA n=2 Tax=Nitratidesulfovibrio vulgaris TaxID=881 RepID=POTA_NITV2|nr:spermidine/putrescine ABC transporter ATP-binding protein PotA [Nitratidesulfovibrio vulgaris]Q72FW5.1 RecName: Full=Spermidine/putrescine import ATP-binding protein PotA [Nitratidesulfovibrio vulgaris str. Hildenborough]GEB81163.1 spermidine/putrescine import ATP-binding protein PotA [Desulfovibrio desulfuricans]HBW14710.1 spermidine/putrescine ABC transporter ATP-binding protein [Desulfovibrio sp.]AAS94582.1 polyamine ABC transporter, ATP-binding protein [Nitratidesulfovibrio vulgaris str.